MVLSFVNNVVLYVPMEPTCSQILCRCKDASHSAKVRLSTPRLAVVQGLNSAEFRRFPDPDQGSRLTPSKCRSEPMTPDMRSGEVG